MPTTPEAKFSRRVREALQHYGCAVERIENRVNLGIPDMLVGVGDKFVMLELKVVTRGLKIDLRPHQVAFLARHSRAGRPCFVLVLYEGTTRRPGFVALYPGSRAIDLVETGISTPQAFSWPSFEVDWPALVAALSAPPP